MQLVSLDLTWNEYKQVDFFPQFSPQMFRNDGPECNQVADNNTLLMFIVCWFI